MLSRRNGPGVNWRQAGTDVAMPLALGALTTLAFAPFNVFFLNLLTLAALYELWSRATPRQALLRGWLFGLGHFGTGIYWIFISVHVYGGAPAWLALLLIAVLVAYMAVYPALVGFVSARWMGGGPALRGLLVWPALWTLSELLRAWVFTGFPWLSTGYAWVGTPLRVAGPVVGVFGMSWLVAFAAGLLWLLLRGPHWSRRLGALGTGIVLAAVILALPGPLQWTHVAREKPVSATLIQGNIPQDEKWDPLNLEPTMARYRRMTLESERSRLLIWPEAAIPALYDQVKALYFDDLDRILELRGQTLLTGMLVRDQATGDIYNGMVALGVDQGTYLKRHLVPFGEYFPVPEFIKPAMELLNLPHENISAGSDGQAPLMVAGIPVGVFICFEAVFSSVALDAVPEAQLLVNISNDAWFGDSIAAAQHLQITRMRALESGRPILRATNTGISAAIGPDGSLYGITPMFVTDRLRVTAVPRAGATPFVRYGNLPLWIGTLVCVLAGLGWVQWHAGARERRRAGAHRLRGYFRG